MSPTHARISIGRVADDQLADVAEIARTTLRDFVVASGGDPTLFTEAFLRSTLQRSTILVAVHADQVVGYLQYQVQPATLVINGAALRPAWQRQGIGTELFRRAVDRADEAGCSGVQISVQPANESVYQLYLRLGFEAGDNSSGWNQELSMDLEDVRRLLAERASN